MTTTEKLADDLGQITFRLEASFETHTKTKTSAIRLQSELMVLRDIEKLKELKETILKHAK